MKTKTRTPEETYARAVSTAQEELTGLDPRQTALKASVAYEESGGEGGSFRVPFLGDLYHVEWPSGAIHRAGDGTEADVTTRIILLHYLLTANGAPMAHKWIAFRNLPGGMGYFAAFRGRASNRLAWGFGVDQEAFERGARGLGGESLTFGDASFMFRVLPRVWMAAVLHVADEEFPAEANVLFDGAASHYLPTEDLAVLGGVLASRLLRAAFPK